MMHECYYLHNRLFIKTIYSTLILIDLLKFTCYQCLVPMFISVSYVELLEDLTAHLTSVIEKQERILSILQESVVGDYLDVNAKYHGCLIISSIQC